MVEHHVYFAAFGFADEPLTLTLLTATEPDEIWRKGEPYSAALPEAARTENRWIISSGLDHHASHSDHFEKLLLKLERLGPGLQALQQRYRCGIGVSRYYFMDDPDFYLEPSLISRFRQLDLNVSFNQFSLDNSTEISGQAPGSQEISED